MVAVAAVLARLLVVLEVQEAVVLAAVVLLVEVLEIHLINLLLVVMAHQQFHIKEITALLETVQLITEEVLEVAHLPQVEHRQVLMLVLAVLDRLQLLQGLP
jgi:hypothetical protein